MYIRRSLKILVLAVSVFAAGSLWLPGVSLAADVWCCSHDGRTFYLDSDSINAANLPKGMDAIGWELFPKALLVSDDGLRCGPLEDKLTEIKGLLEFIGNY